MEEVWKDIPGYNGRYQASTFGRIRSVNRIIQKSNGVSEYYQGKVLATSSVRGYLYVNIAKDINDFHPKRVHRLIAETFIPNPGNLSQINHINENKSDNRVTNLEWCTSKYNSNYGHRIEKFSASMQNNLSHSKEVNQYDLEGNYLNSFPSASEAARILGLSSVAATRIGQCCRHLYLKGNSAYGFLWKFATPKNKGIPIERLQVGTPVYQYSLDNCLIKKWDNIKTAAQSLKVDGSNINRACKYNRTCGGFKWSKALLNSNN